MMELFAQLTDEALLADKPARRESGHTVERCGDTRTVHTLIGEVTYARTYYKKARGGYGYLTDTVLGVEKSERVSEGLSLALVKAAKDMSYGKASKHVTSGDVSNRGPRERLRSWGEKQSVMTKLRRSEAAKPPPEEVRCVPELHIDADEAHVTLHGGKKSIVPVISVYEGIDKQSKRHFCKNVFHISEYGKPPDEPMTDNSCQLTDNSSYLTNTTRTRQSRL
jgi:hypothetical protein